MYSASANFITAIKSNVRKMHWDGSINLDTPLDLDDDNFFSGGITRAIAGNGLNIGTVYASQISADLILSGVSRYELYGKEISISSSIDGANDNIPMGIFTISEAIQASDHISIKGYDNMTKFADVPFSASLHNAIQTPYAWLLDACNACSVALGNTSAEVQAMPNGNRVTGFADVVTDAKTWRDVLGYMAAYLGGFAYIGRDGKLYIGHYEAISNDTIPASGRFSSGLSDFRTTYDGLYAVYKEGGVQEYVSNNNSDGLVLDIGINPFLQFSDQTNRLAALQEIINAWNNVYYVPFKATMPLMSHYDVGDVLTFTEKQASIYDYGVISEITYKFDGDMSVTCSGDNPKLTASQDRFSKTVAGLSKDYNNGQEVGTKNFWLLHTENTGQLTIGSTWTQVAEIEFKQTTDVQRLGTVFSCEAVLSATSTVEVRITIDDEEAYRYDIKEEKMMKGTRIVPSSKAFRVTDKGTHVAKVYMKVTDNPTLWGDLV